MRTLVAAACVALCVAAATPASASAPKPATDPPYLRVLLARARTQKLWNARRWHLLVHYHRTLFGGFESDAEGKKFFVAKDGKHDPRAELEATLRAFFAPVRDVTKMQPQCRFPARFKFLTESLHADPAKLRALPCPRFETWRAALDPGSASLVFASAYMGSPASMYGHTMLLLGRKGMPKGSTLLSYVISYAAVPWTYFPPLYAILGLTGGFPGRFASLPYYVKVQEYSNLESRDLWAYHLDLTPDQIDWVVRHAWELGSTSFPYYFVKENCAYELLTLLEVADPKLHLVRRFPVFTIPVDTIRAVEEAGLTTGTTFRPSEARVMRAARARLHGDEIDLAADLEGGDLARAKARLARLAPRRAALVLDAAEDLFTYEHGEKDPFPKKKPSAGELALRTREAELLRLRGRIPVQTSAAVPRTPPAPESGHASSRFGLGAGVSDDGHPYLVYALRPALSDLLDDQRGYVLDNAIEFLSLKLRVRPDLLATPDGAVLDADVIHIVSLTPMAGWVHKISWRLDLGVGPPVSLGCERWHCVEAHLSGGPGIAARTHILGRETWYLFADAEVAAGPALHPGASLRLGATAGALLQLGPRWRMHLFAGWHAGVLGDPGDPARRLFVALGQSVSVTRDFELRLDLSLSAGRPQGALTAFLYF